MLTCHGGQIAAVAPHCLHDEHPTLRALGWLPNPRNEVTLYTLYSYFILTFSLDFEQKITVCWPYDEQSDIFFTYGRPKRFIEASKKCTVMHKFEENWLDLLRAMSGPNFCIATNVGFLAKITTKLATPSDDTIPTCRRSLWFRWARCRRRCWSRCRARC